jgi:flagellar basal body-associated protein FliL
MEILVFVLCFVVFGFFIITTDFKQNKITNIIMVVLCVTIISVMGYTAFCMESTPKNKSVVSSVAPTESTLDKINDRLDKIERKMK